MIAGLIGKQQYTHPAANMSTFMDQHNAELAAAEIGAEFGKQ
jgi:hypothetical protein